MTTIQQPLTLLFAQLDCAVEALCSAVPWPWFIALMLRLSKRTRKEIWQYLSNPDKLAVAWVDTFCRRLWLHHDRRPQGQFTFCNMHPCFYRASERIKESAGPTYSVCKLLVGPREIVDRGLCHALVGGFFARIPDDACGCPGWEMASNCIANEIFEWYFVASAIAQCFDRAYVRRAQDRWGDLPIVPHDKFLFCA